MTHNRKEDRSIVRDKTHGWVSGWAFALRAGDRGLNPCRDKPRPISKLWKQELGLFDIWWRLHHRTVMLCKVSWVMIFFNSCIPYIFNGIKTSIQLHIVLNLWSFKRESVVDHCSTNVWDNVIFFFRTLIFLFIKLLWFLLIFTDIRAVYASDNLKVFYEQFIGEKRNFWMALSSTNIQQNRVNL